MPTLLDLLDKAMLLGGAGVWVWAGMRWYRREPILQFVPRRPVPWEGIDLLLVIGAVILLQALCLSIGVKWSGIALPKNWSDLDAQSRYVLLASNMVGTAITLVAAIAVLKLRSRATAKDMGFVSRAIPRDLLIGLATFVAAAPIVMGLQWIVVHWIPYEHQIVDAVQQENDSKMWLVAVLSALVVAPAFEEFVFRVVLQGWLEKVELKLARQQAGLNPDVSDITEDTPQSPLTTPQFLGLTPGLLPIVISSFLFALMHWGQGGAPIPLFVFALFLGFLYQRTHRYWPPLVVHMLLNGISLLMFFVERKVTP